MSISDDLVRAVADLVTENKRLIEDRDEWQQAAGVEAGLRREFQAEVERLRLVLQDIAINSDPPAGHPSDHRAVAAVARHALNSAPTRLGLGDIGDTKIRSKI